MTFDLYAESILDELRHPQNNFPLEKYDLEYDATNASCGDGFKIQIQLNGTKQKVTAIGWQGNGCAISTAALSRVSALAINEDIVKILTWDKKTMLKLLDLNSITVGRERCLLVGLAGIQRALKTAVKTDR